jgi:LmbE family N-acetylglucosaminyl deacetylase
MNNILVIAPHPDDETIGCGGTLLKHRENGDQIFWLILSHMLKGECWSEKEIDARKQEIKRVANKFQFTDTYELNYPTTKLDQVPMGELVSSIAECINKICPAIVYLPNPTDSHTDHQIAFKAGHSCTKSFRFPFVKKVLVYETLSETEFSPNIGNIPFSPNVYIDISSYLDEKLEILGIYANQLGEHPFPRSIENIKALATLRGATSNCRYAEGFYLVKSIE